MYRFHFSYKDLSSTSKFLKGKNIYLQEDDIKAAIDKFNEENPNCDIQGVLKTKEDANIT